MSRRIAIISDIHANFNALSMVMTDMEQFEVDEIFCLGDIISIGHQTNEVLHMLRGLDHLSVIRGNHDEEVLKVIRGMPSSVTGAEHDHHVWVADHLDSRFVPFLDAMPLSMNKSIMDFDILLTHYHLNPDDTYCPIDMSPSVETLGAIYEEDPYDIILFGHDHMQHHFESGQQVFINPGPLGLAPNGHAPYTIMEINGEAVNFIHRKVPYDHNDFVEGLKRKNPPAIDFIMNVLLKERG
ncbi:metallophosphoesterase family protein [Salinicoccus sp. ID82-1]|uniref:metallophosphoesterase family protein n=1 Tax=Salinicoccus sp. ID82-1 TaxID=2820269 RepID=UPI001F3FAEC3|nr:metallophosphoesterase family protein [Salinicoccus sp. ID82-1]MCG1009352.1 metallophosphoesterase family protein [Salinicoccus sp. ID82-1]